MNVLGIQRRYPKPLPAANHVVRRGQWKLMMLAEKPVGLFNIEHDPDEKANVLADLPEVVTALAAELGI